jgi:hypothetical protein
MTIEIPVKKHVKCFLMNQQVWGCEPVKARLNSPAGKIISSVLSQYPIPVLYSKAQLADELVCPEPEIDPLWKDGDTVKVKVTFPMTEEYITDDNLLRLGYLLEDYFEQSLQFFVLGRMDRLPTEQGAVKQFYHLFKIDPEMYDFDAAFKVVRRRGMGEKRK